MVIPQWECPRCRGVMVLIKKHPLAPDTAKCLNCDHKEYGLQTLTPIVPEPITSADNPT